MAEYIEREALIAEFKRLKLGENSFIERVFADGVYAIIEQFPAADVVSAVRCKDCIHYDLGVCLKIYSDGNAQKDSWQSRNPNDFCSYGEKRDGGADND